MPLTKALAAISAGALMLIGHSAVAQDPYTDRTQDRQATTQTQTDRDRTQTQAQVRTQDDFDDEDDTFTAQTWDDDDDADAEFRAEIHTDDDEFTAQERTTTETQWETDTETTAQTWDDDADAEFRAETRTQDHDMQVGVGTDVNDERLQTLAQIHLEMQDETRELADELAVSASAEEAQEFQAKMVDRQVSVIERHGWSRDEYNEIVDQVNEDAQLRSRFIDMVVQRDDQVGARFDDETQFDDDAEFTAEAEFDTEDDWDTTDDEFAAEARFEDDRDDTVAGDFEDDRR